MTPHQNSLPYRQIPGKAYPIFKLYSRQTCGSKLSHSSRKGSFPGSPLISSIQRRSGPMNPTQGHTLPHRLRHAASDLHPHPFRVSLLASVTFICVFLSLRQSLAGLKLVILLPLLSEDITDMDTLHTLNQISFLIYNII